MEYKKTSADTKNMPYANKKVYELIQKETNGSVRAFAQSINVSQQSLNRIFCIDKRNGKYPSVSNEIKKGIIDVYGKDEIWFIADVNSGENPILKSDKDEITTKDGTNYLLVPIIHIDSVGGMRSNNSIAGEPQYIEGYVPFVNAREGDKAIFQSGTSMIPTIPPGSILQIREVVNWKEYFGYGNIFVIELKDGRRITKEVRRYDENPQEYIWCVSHNPDVQDEELPKSMIESVWKVVKILTDKGW